MSDDGFHEIQLNGKQLVFLFMATTVVSVVIFLCGVLVGRGVRAERAAVEPAELAALEIAAETEALPVDPPADIRAAEPGAPGAGTEDLSYPNRLEGTGAPVERLKPATDTASAVRAPEPARAAPPDAPAESRVAEPPPVPTPAETARPAPPAAAEEPAPALATGSGFTIQVAALKERAEADEIARRLASKGYDVYVVSPSAGTPAMYRVRIGRYPNRRDAEPVVRRLEREEQFKPWITR